MKHFYLAALLALSAVLTGCETYRDEYVPPSTPEGRACTMACLDGKQRCEVDQQVLRQRCEADFNRVNRDYQNCKAMNSRGGQCTSWRSVTKTVNGQTITTQECTSTRYDDPCGNTPTSNCYQYSASNCSANYQTCYRGCGGSVLRIKEN